MATAQVANSDTFEVTTPTPTSIQMTRLFDAPREIVFQAMNRPEHVQRWWGHLGDGYTVPVCEIDLRVGGQWRLVNRTPTGDLAPFRGEYREIDRPGRVVYTEVFEPFPVGEAVVTAVLAEERGKTRMTLVATYPTEGIRDLVLKTGMESGAAISYDRLEEIAAELSASRREPSRP
jgi:uncharacterized protein YndB with AHSA1/START domain